MTDVHRTDAPGTTRANGTTDADAGGEDRGGSAGDGVLSAAGQEAFAAELARLRASSSGGPLDRRLAVLGVVLALVGLATMLVAYTQATGFDDYRDQVESLILAVFGLGLTGLGAALYVRSSLARFLRYWLLRMVYEQRDRAR